MRKGFCDVFLEECLIYFKMCGDDKKYVYIVRYGVCLDRTYFAETEN